MCLCICVICVCMVCTGVCLACIHVVYTCAVCACINVGHVVYICVHMCCGWCAHVWYMHVHVCRVYGVCFVTYVLDCGLYPHCHTAAGPCPVCVGGSPEQTGSRERHLLALRGVTESWSAGPQVQGSWLCGHVLPPHMPCSLCWHSQASLFYLLPSDLLHPAAPQGASDSVCPVHSGPTCSAQLAHP